MKGMRRHPLTLALAALAWVGFIVVSAWTALFLADVVVSRTVDDPRRLPTVSAILIDLALLLLFVGQHSVMARQPVKSWLRRRLPQRLERTGYVLATDVCLVLLLVWWQPWGGEIWRLTGVAAIVVWALYAAGWLLAIGSTFAVDHLELTGLRQAGWAAPRQAEPAGLTTGGLYAVVRHPLLSGLLIVFWATPRMSAGHLLLAAAVTGYILVGIRFEERDLRRTFGSAYDEYAARVPALLPRWRATSPAAPRE